MPLHIMFSSDAKQESNYAVNAAWILDLPHVLGQFGHDKEKLFPASATTNEKGGTDGRVLKQVLLHYVKNFTLMLLTFQGNEYFSRSMEGLEDLIFTVWWSCKVWVFLCFWGCKTPPMSHKKQIIIMVSSKACYKSTFSSF